MLVTVQSRMLQPQSMRSYKHAAVIPSSPETCLSGGAARLCFIGLHVMGTGYSGCIGAGSNRRRVRAWPADIFLRPRLVCFGNGNQLESLRESFGFQAGQFAF